MGKGENTRQAILEHALGLSSRIGLQALSFGRLAEELGLSKSGLYAHFKSKQDLQLQVLARGADEFLEAVVKTAFTAPKGEPRVRQLFENWLEWTRTNPYAGGCPFVQFSFELDDQPGALRDQLLRQQRGWLEILAESGQRAVAEGDFRADLDPAQFAYEFEGLMLGYHHAARLLRDPQAELRLRRSFENFLKSAKE